MTHYHEQVKALHDAQAIIVAELNACFNITLARCSAECRDTLAIEKAKMNRFEENLLEHNRLFDQFSAKLQTDQQKVQGALSEISKQIVMVIPLKPQLQTPYNHLTIAIWKNRFEEAKGALNEIKPLIAHKQLILPQVNHLESLFSMIIGLKPALESLALKLKDQSALISVVNEEYGLIQEDDEVSEGDEASLDDDTDTDSCDSGSLSSVYRY